MAVPWQFANAAVYYAKKYSVASRLFNFLRVLIVHLAAPAVPTSLDGVLKFLDEVFGGLRGLKNLSAFC